MHGYVERHQTAEREQVENVVKAQQHVGEHAEEQAEEHEVVLELLAFPEEVLEIEQTHHGEYEPGEEVRYHSRHVIFLFSFKYKVKEVM